MSGYTDWGAPWTVEYPYIFGISGQSNTYYDVWTGKYLGPFYKTTSFRWNSFRFYNKANRMGILDPQTFVNKFAQYNDMTNTGSLLTAVGAWCFPASLNKTYPAAGAFLLKGVPYLESVKTVNAPLGWQYSSSRSINVKCKYPERVVALFDYLLSDEFQREEKVGLQNVNWKYGKDGKPILIGDSLKRYKGDAAAQALFGIGKKYDYGMYGKLYGVDQKICADGYPSDFTVAPYFKAANAVMTTPLKNFLNAAKASKGIKFPGQVYQQWVDKGISKTNPSPSIGVQFNFTPKQPDDLAQIATNIENYIADNQARLVMAKSASEFNSILSDMCSNIKSMGEDQVYNDAIKRYDQSKAIAKQILK